MNVGITIDLTYNEITHLSEFAEYLKGGNGYFEIYVRISESCESSLSDTYFVGENNLEDLTKLLTDLSMLRERIISAHNFHENTSVERLGINFLREIRADYDDIFFTPTKLGMSKEITRSKAQLKLSGYFNENYRELRFDYFLNRSFASSYYDDSFMTEKQRKKRLELSYLSQISKFVLQQMIQKDFDSLADSKYGINPFELYSDF